MKHVTSTYLCIIEKALLLAHVCFFKKIFFIEAVIQRCYVKKVLLEISLNSQENTCTRISFLIKLQA